MPMLEKSWTLPDVVVTGCPSVVASSAGPLILAGTRNGHLLALDAAGAEAWRVSLGAPVSMWPVVDNVPDPGLSVLIGTEAGRIACLSPSGEVRWTTQMDAGLTSFNSVARLRGGGDVQFVATTRDGVVTGLDAAGKPRWRFTTHADSIYRHLGAGPAALGDIDGDGRDEIAVSASDGFVYCLAADGRFLWNVYTGNESQWSAPVMADLGDGPCVIAGGTADLVWCIGSDGKVRWTQRGIGAGFIEVGLSVGDINGDGRDEVVFVHQGRAIQAVDGRGELVWGSMDYKGGDQPFGPSIADLDGDGRMEILHAQRHAGPLRVLRGDGTLIEEHDLPGGMVGAPVVADVDGDGLLEVLTVAMAGHEALSGSGGGALSCYRTSAPARPGAAPWPTSRGAFDGRGTRLAPTASGAVAAESTPPAVTLRRTSPTVLCLGMNELAYEPEGSDGALVEVAVTGPDRVTTRSVVGDARRTALRFEALEPGDYAVSATLLEGSTGARRGQCNETLAVRTFAEERGEAQVSLQALADLLEGAGPLQPDLERAYRALRFRWAAVEERIAGYIEAATDERRRTIAEVALALATVRREASCQRLRLAEADERGEPVSFLAWQLKHPWLPFAPEADAPHGPLLEALEVETDGRAHDALAVQLANVLDDALDVRAWFDPLLDEAGGDVGAGAHLTLRQVTRIPTQTGNMNGDALPDLGDAGIVRIAPSSSARIWIDVTTGDLPPGMYTTTLHLRPLTVGGSVSSVPVRWTVLPVALPEAMPLRFCNWGYGYASQFRHAPDAGLRDMQDHHTSVFVSGYSPKALYDASGTITVQPDWTELDAFLAKLRPQDMVLFGGYNSAPVAPAAGAPEVFSDAWRAALAAFLPQWVEHLAERGFGYDRWAFYPVDEPGIRSGALIDILERYGRAVKAVDPRVQIYTDPYRGFTVVDYERLRDVLDIVQPTQYYVVLSENTDRVDYLQTVDHTRWIYEARADVKDEVTPEYYWCQVWTAWRLGFTGVGYWTYCTTGYDLWDAQADYVMVYMGANGPVPSARWQAIRIGIEDYARLARLRDAIATAPGDRAEHAKRRLGEVVAEAEAARWDPGVMARIRREITHLAMEL